MARITLTRNRPYKLSITVKEPGGLTPLEMNPYDDVWMHFKEKKRNGKLILSKQLSPVEKDCQGPTPIDVSSNSGISPQYVIPVCYADGEWILKLDACETKLFEIKEGFNEDGRPYLSGVRAQLSIDFIDHELEFADVMIDDIYVSDIGLPDVPDCDNGDLD